MVILSLDLINLYAIYSPDILLSPRARRQALCLSEKLAGEVSFHYEKLHAPVGEWALLPVRLLCHLVNMQLLEPGVKRQFGRHVGRV